MQQMMGAVFGQISCRNQLWEAYLDSGVREVSGKSIIDSSGDLPQLHLTSGIKAASSKTTTNVKDAHVEAQGCGLVNHLQCKRGMRECMLKNTAAVKLLASI